MKTKRLRPESFAVDGRTFEIRPLPARWQMEFYIPLLSLRQAQNRRDAAAFEKLSSAFALESETDSYVSPCVAVICASQDPDPTKTDRIKIQFWAQQCEESLTRAEMAEIIEKQCALEKPLHRLETIGDDAARLVTSHGPIRKA